MKYLLLILFFYNVNYSSSQVQEYLYVSDIKWEEFRPNNSFFIPIFEQKFEGNIDSDSLVTLINDADNRIYYSLSLLYANDRNQIKIDSLKRLVDLIIKSSKSDTLMFLKKENIVIMKVSLSKQLNYSIHNVNKKMFIPTFFITNDSINRVFTKTNSINFLD